MACAYSTTASRCVCVCVCVECVCGLMLKGQCTGTEAHTQRAAYEHTEGDTDTNTRTQRAADGHTKHTKRESGREGERERPIHGHTETDRQRVAHGHTEGASSSQPKP
jgi:hypothetical protein